MGQQPDMGSLVVVPWAPAALIVPDRERSPDGVDAFVDELFGGDVDENPGWFDAFLLVGGTALALWSALSGAAPVLTLVGVVAGLLGCVLPVRTGWRALRRRNLRRRRRAVLGRGLPLVADDPTTGRLVVAYGRLCEAARLEGMAAVGEEALVAGHQAMIEVATLLDGAAPDTSAQQEYVVARTRAVAHLAGALERQHRRDLAARARDAVEAVAAERSLDRVARMGATEELDARLGPVSLDRMAVLTRELEEDDADADY